MRTPLAALAALSLAAGPLAVVTTSGTAHAAESCTPSITMGTPYQDTQGFVHFPATYSVCDSSLVRVKFRDRSTDDGWGSGSGTVPAGSSGTTEVGTCDPDGEPHRWVAYATVKTPTGGTVLAQSAKVYFRSAPVVGNCG